MPAATQLLRDVFYRPTLAGLAGRPASRSCGELLSRCSDFSGLFCDGTCWALPIVAAPPAFVPHQAHRPTKRRQIHQLDLLSPSDHNRPPQLPHSGLGVVRRTLIRSGSPCCSSTVSISTSPSPTKSSLIRVESDSTGSSSFSGCCFHYRFRRIPPPLTHRPPNTPLRPQTRRAGKPARCGGFTATTWPFNQHCGHEPQTSAHLIVHHPLHVLYLTRKCAHLAYSHVYRVFICMFTELLCVYLQSFHLNVYSRTI